MQQRNVRRKDYEYLYEEIKGRDHTGYLSDNRRIIIKWILKDLLWRMWIELPYIKINDGELLNK